MMGERVNQVEHVVTDSTTTVNDIIDANEESEEERHWIHAKITDLEDRSRRNNVKLRGCTRNCACSRPHAIRNRAL